MKVGIDIVDIKRFEKLTISFISKNFLESEIKYADTKPNIAQTMAGIFACKEAFLKAIGVGIFKGIKLSDIEICHEKSGKPFLKINPDISAKLQIKNCDVSISHDGGIASAICVLN